MKNFFFFIFLFLPVFCLSQKTDVSLSVEWQEEKVYFQNVDSNNNLINVPYLTINYKNLSTDNLILKRPIPNNEYYLPILADILLNTPLTIEERATKYNNYSKDFHTCYLTNYGIYEDVYDEQDSMIYQQSATVSYSLMQLYLVFDAQRRLDLEGSNMQLKCFKYPQKEDITYKEWNLYKSKDREVERCLFSNKYVVLRPKEEIKQKICILPFYLVKGTYFFKIKLNDLIEDDFNRTNMYNYLYKMPFKEEDINIKNIEITF
ncbi:MAG: hypothetical protein LBV69_01085 [Bacteroidales bacterium]|jgi:hypothetical protein|nr:hypothetical protein [Bacteroidales bacterium]